MEAKHNTTFVKRSSGGLITSAALAAALAGTLAVSTPVSADDRNDYRRSSVDLGRIVLNVANSDRYDRRTDIRYSNYNRYNRAYERNRHVDSRYRHSGPVTVRLNYDANGDGQIGLKRMLKNQHGIDPNEWRIRSVNVRHKSRREACADLTVGGRSTGPVYLRKGITTIVAPRGDRDGRWVLGFENVKLRDVAVVLEPRRGNRGGKYRPLDRDDGHRDLSFNSRNRW